MSQLNSHPRHIVVMGVAGCGKTTIAKALATSTGLEYAEADEFHPAANIEKMSAGIPLNDEDRRPWLEDLSQWMAGKSEQGISTVTACSALKVAYRDMLRSGPPSCEFVHLAGPIGVLRERMDSRTDHFMPSSLLDSQYADLEPLGEGESGLTISFELDPHEIEHRILQQLSLENKLRETLG